MKKSSGNQDIPVDQKQRATTEKIVNCSRRKALKTIAVGTAAAGAIALAGKWSKPVVNSIILPAHAQAQTLPSRLQQPQVRAVPGSMRCTPV